MSIARAYALLDLLQKIITDLPEATTPLTSSGVPTVVSNWSGFTEIFLGAAFAIGVKTSEAITAKESKRFTLIPANDRGPPSSP